MSMERWRSSSAYSRIRWTGQMGRVISVLAGYEYLTLREIESRIHAIESGKKAMNPNYTMNLDTQAAISARIREVRPSKHGLVKQKTMEIVNGKQVHRYRLVPTVPVKEVAKSVGVPQ